MVVLGIPAISRPDLLHACLSSIDADVRLVCETFGEHRALDLIWYVSWCNYMTRVADAFQLPLEQENVFLEPQPPEEKSPADDAQ